MVATAQLDQDATTTGLMSVSISITQQFVYVAVARQMEN